MRKLIFSLLALFVFLGVLISPVRAQLLVEPAVEGLMDVMAEEKVEYDLPYPGLLPDHPLYKLKMIRDRIWGFLIRDPLKKSQWCLLMADKRIWAAQMLAEKGRDDLAVTTASKAEKYLEMAIEKAYQAEAMGKGDRSFIEKLTKACLKHEEVLEQTLALLAEESKPALKEVLEYPKIGYQKVLELMPKE